MGVLNMSKTVKMSKKWIVLSRNVKKSDQLIPQSTSWSRSIPKYNALFLMSHPFCSFCVILVTNKQNKPNKTHKQTHNLLVKVQKPELLILIQVTQTYFISEYRKKVVNPYYSMNWSHIHMGAASCSASISNNCMIPSLRWRPGGVCKCDWKPQNIHPASAASPQRPGTLSETLMFLQIQSALAWAEGNHTHTGTQRRFGVTMLQRHWEPSTCTTGWCIDGFIDIDLWLLALWHLTSEVRGAEG